MEKKYLIMSLLLSSGVLELLLGIPIIGNILTWDYQPYPILIAFLVHLATMIICIVYRGPIIPSILAILSLSVSWLPLIGWGIHMFISGILLTSGFMLKQR